VLAEFTTTSGNFTTVTRSILAELPQVDTRMSYIYDNFVFHYIVADGLVYLCMTEASFGRSVPFLFLDDVIRRWAEAYSDRGKTALAYGMNEDFSAVLQRQMDYFSRDVLVQDSTLSRVADEVEDVRQVMVENIDRVLERGERIELLVDKAENLNQQAFQFRKQSGALRRALWIKNLKIGLVICSIVALFALFISMGVCGADFKKCGATGGEASGGGGHNLTSVVE